MNLSMLYIPSLVIGLVICVVFGVMLIITAFKESTTWGLMYLFVPFANLYFIIKYWDECKKPFLYGLLGLPFMFFGIYGMAMEKVKFKENQKYLASVDSNCKVYNHYPKAGEAIRWSGSCVDGFAEGEGTVQWYEYGNKISEYSGNFSKGQIAGEGITMWPDGSNYKGYINKNGDANGNAEMRLSRGNKSIESWEQNGIGSWDGDVYVIKGIWQEGDFIKEL